jgi:2-succinyl-5-enolpyruvyl-6-hydroxy-3-cyclohexene-1-carboxylate synthase
LHDMNSLALVKNLREPIIIVVLNNNGGGIFSFLPIASSPGAADFFDSFFGTPHHLEFQQAARMFGLDYAAPISLSDFADIYRKALSEKTSIIIEIKSQRDDNFQGHRKLEDRIKAEIDNLLE